MAKKKLNQLDPATITLSRLLGHGNPSTGKMNRATVGDLVALFSAQTPIKSYADETALLANTDLAIGYVGYVVDDEIFYLYNGPAATDINNYTRINTIPTLEDVLTLDNDAHGLQIKNLFDGSDPQDAVTVGQLAAAALGIVSSWKAPVKVATAVAGTLATSFENGDTVDGVVLVTGDRILIKNQAAQTENGIYVVAASGAPARSSDANTAAELEGVAVMVQQGTVGLNTTWIQTTDGITLGVSNIVWAQMGTSGPIAASAVTNTPAGGIAATDVQAAINELDTEKAALSAVSRGLAMVAATGAVISFAIPQYYGSASAITGNITFSTTGAILGMEQLMRHNSATEPTLSVEFKKMEGSRNYVTNVDNFLYCKYLSATKIQYTWNQEQ